MEQATKKLTVGDGAIIVPAITMLFAAPFALTEVRDPSSPFGPSPQYPFLPFWIGLLCVPGYISAWRSVKKGQPQKVGRKAWQALSVLIGAACSFVGAVYAAFTLLGGLLAVWSGIVALLLLRRLLKASVDPTNGANLTAERVNDFETVT